MATCLDSRAFSQTNMCRLVKIIVRPVRKWELFSFRRLPYTTVVEQKPRAEEPKLNCLPEPEPKLWIAAPVLAPAPFCLPRTFRNFKEKHHGCWRNFETCYIYSYYAGVGAGTAIRICCSLEPESKEIFLAPKHCLTEGLSWKWNSIYHCFFATGKSTSHLL